MIPVNLFAVALATITNCIIGFLWYGPLFGKKWQHEVGITNEKKNELMKKGMLQSMVGMIVGAFLVNYVLAQFIVLVSAYMGTTGIHAGLMTAIWVWIGFCATLTINPVLWQGKRWVLWFIDAGSYLVMLSVAGTIMGYWM